MVRKLKCGTHGSVDWNGEVMCSCCSAIYNREEVQKIFDGSGLCSCKRMLLGTAVAICSDCYEKLNRKKKGDTNEQGNGGN